MSNFLLPEWEAPCKIVKHKLNPRRLRSRKVRSGAKRIAALTVASFVNDMPTLLIVLDYYLKLVTVKDPKL